MKRVDLYTAWMRHAELELVNTLITVIMSWGCASGYPQGCVRSVSQTFTCQPLQVIAPSNSFIMSGVISEVGWRSLAPLWPLNLSLRTQLSFLLQSNRPGHDQMALNYSVINFLPCAWEWGSCKAPWHLYSIGIFIVVNFSTVLRAPGKRSSSI